MFLCQLPFWQRHIIFTMSQKPVRFEMRALIQFFKEIFCSFFLMIIQKQSAWISVLEFSYFIVKFYTSTWNLNLLFQVLALSATYPDELASLVEKFMRSPQHVRIAQTNQVLCGVMQFVQLLEFSPSQIKQNQIKQEALLKILSCIPYNQCLVFSNYQVKKSIYVFYKNEDNYLLMCSLISWQEDSAGWSKTRWMQKCTGEIWHISNGHTIFKRPDKLPFITCYLCVTYFRTAELESNIFFFNWWRGW